MSCPCHQPEKWNGMNVVPGPTRSVTIAFTLICAPVGDFTQTYSLSLIRRALASFGLSSRESSLLEPGAPRIRPRFLAAAFVFDQAAARQPQRELRSDAIRDIL